MEEMEIEMVAGDGKVGNGRLFLIEESSPGDDQLTVAMEMGGERYEASAETYFEAFVMVRRQLEPVGVLPRCNGTLINVYPSPMSLSMGDGRKAYRLIMGKQALMKDLVDIFDKPEETEGELATVQDQAEFYDRWISSISGR